MNREEFDKLFEETKGQGWAQDPNELWEVVKVVQDLTPHRRILEIGLESGKSLRIWEVLAGSAGKVVGVDLQDNTTAQHFDKRPLVITGDSTKAETFEQAAKAFEPPFFNAELDNRAEVDFLFIDGDHSFEGVSKDFSFYSRLVRKGGIVGFHDTRIPCIKRFFDSLPLPKQTFDYGTYGIGIVRF